MPEDGECTGDDVSRSLKSRSSLGIGALHQGAGGWQHHVGDDLTGKTLGVLGLGNIGDAVAKVGTAFGMKVIAWSQNLTAERAAAAAAALVTKEDLFRQADFLTIHLVLSDRTRGLIGAKELKRVW